MLTPRYIIGFTGHRSGIDEAVVRSALNDALVGFQELAAKNSGRAELYSSVAEGSDTLCVETARQLNMPVHILLPMDELEFASDFTSAEAWLRSNRQIERARQRPCRDSVHQAPGETERPDCYFNQGMHILSAADILVAVWDGLPARGLGGTAEVVEQAIAIGIPVLQIDPRTGAVSMIGEISSNFAPDPVIAQLNRLESQRMTERISASDPDSLQTRLDKIAMEEASRFRPSLVRIILLHGTAALLAA